ncbi:60S ribosomal protein L7a [Sciurus carolinensis]|uniref:60S ribosomal protein L7a n=1 Tax=Sciurus carolinensis TaxID=30640 RepID=A0AA41T7B7_SCICA|nr:60S ribosomal protein L7a [Sciurus carolinensis]
MSPIRPQILPAGINTVTILVENKKAQLVAGCPACPVSQDGRPLLPHQGEGQAGKSGSQETCTPVAFTQVNSEVKGALAKLVEAIRTNSNDRCDESLRHRGGKVLGPKSMARIAKLGKANAKII